MTRVETLLCAVLIARTRDTPRANNRTLRSKRPTSVRMLLLCLRPRLLLLCLLPRLLLFLQLLLKAHLLPRLLLHPETTCVAERAVAAPPGRLRGMTLGASPLARVEDRSKSIRNSSPSSIRSLNLSPVVK